MKLLKIIMLLLMSLMLCSCEDTFISSNESSVALNTPDRGDVEEISNKLESDLLKTYGNINIIQAHVGMGKTMPSYDVEIVGNSEFKFQTIIDVLYETGANPNYTVYEKGAPIYKEYPATFEPSNYAGDGIRTPNSYAYTIKEFIASEEDFTKSVYSYSMGDIWGSQTGASHCEYYYFEDYYVFETYNLLYDIIPENKEYRMSDGESWNLGDAVEYVENFWNTYLSESDATSYTYIVKNAYVIKLNTEEYGFLFEMIRMDGNGNFYDVDSGYIENESAIQNNEPFLFGNPQFTWFAEKEKLTRFSKDFSILPIKQTSEGKDLLTLYSAGEILSESLAPNINLTIDSAELNYVAVCKGYPYFQIWEYPSYYKGICLNTCEFEIKPFWCFRTKQNTLLDRMTCQIYFVDAVSGELHIMKY